MTIEHFLWTFITSAAPVVELRLSLPLALDQYNMAWYYALPICYAGNLLPVPFLLWFLGPLTRFLSRIEFIKRLIEWVFERTRRHGKLVEKYERIGLVLVVAIPLPGTGAWTGAILAFLFGLEFKKSLVSIAVGVLIAGIIVTVFTLLGWIGAIAAGITLVALAALGLWRV